MILADKKLREYEDEVKKRIQENFDSITGKFGSVDCHGVDYITYAFGADFDIQKDVLSVVGKRLVEFTFSTIRKLVVTKSVETPEGATVTKRSVIIHWRKWPELSYHEPESKDEKSRLQIRFRISVHHKELPQKNYIIGETK